MTETTEINPVKTKCDCGTKLFTKFIDIGKCAKCQGKFRTNEYYKENIKLYDEKHGISKEERNRIKKEFVKISRQRRREREKNSILENNKVNDI